MQSHYDERFEREMGCTAAELIAWLPRASGPKPLAVSGASAEIALEPGRLLLEWQPLPERRIGLIVLPRLHVRFRFDGAGDEARQRFMRRFDLYTQRGGG